MTRSAIFFLLALVVACFDASTAGASFLIGTSVIILLCLSVHFQNKEKHDKIYRNCQRWID